MLGLHLHKDGQHPVASGQGLAEWSRQWPASVWDSLGSHPIALQTHGPSPAFLCLEEDVG